MPRSLLLALIAFFSLACQPRAQDVALENAFPNLSFSQPVGLEHASDGSDQLYVVEQEGRLVVFSNSASTSTSSVFLDITDRVASGGERGLLGLAFAPDYAQSGHLYVNYTASNPLRTRVSRFSRSSSNPDVADPSSEEILLTVDQPYANHNAGAILFGPPEGSGNERYLYVTMGDGGDAGDPDENGEDPTTLLGSILRLDVDGGGQPLDCASGTGSATVPADNPFVDTASACDEIWAYGFRNPWRMTLDPATGQIWTGDVGQNAWEEIDILERGGNFGWDILEGTHCFEPSSGCSTDGTVLPVWEYSHSLGCSITGGYVYRGSAIPELVGEYVYSDYCSGRVWRLDYDGSTAENEQFLTTTLPTSFGTDADGELYVLSAAGTIQKFVRTPPLSTEEPTDSNVSGLSLRGSNPLGSQALLRLTGDGPARLVLYDLLGREVALLFEGRLRSDSPQDVTVDTSALPRGRYVAYLLVGNASAVQTLTIAR